MKLGNNLIIFISIICLTSSAQSTLKGVNAQGITISDRVAGDQPLGIVMQLRANKGVQLNGTNVQAWNDISGHGFNVFQYNSTNQPSSIFFGTNKLGQPMKSVYFDISTGTGIDHLRGDSVAPLLSGLNLPFTTMAVCNGQTNGTVTMVSTGWSASTNVNASRWGMRPNNTTATQSLFFKSSNTNSASFAPALSGGKSTNIWTMYVVTYDGVNISQFNNLTPTIVSGPCVQTTTTLDMFTIGCSRHTNFVNAAWQGAIAEYRLYTNSLTGSQVTNLVNQMNKAYNLF